MVSTRRRQTGYLAFRPDTLLLCFLLRVSLTLALAFTGGGCGSGDFLTGRGPGLFHGLPFGIESRLADGDVARGDRDARHVVRHRIDRQRSGAGAVQLDFRFDNEIAELPGQADDRSVLVGFEFGALESAVGQTAPACFTPCAGDGSEPRSGHFADRKRRDQKRCVTHPTPL